MKVTLLSKIFNPVLRFIPNEHKYTSKSQKLLLYYNLISPSSHGTYTIMPILQRSLDKLINIINNEMSFIDAQKLTMPSLGRSSIWKISGRWKSMENEIFKVMDDKSKEMCLQPTHEEEVTSLLSSYKPFAYKQMPILFYQITPKFRKEVAPKGGLIRSREFLMKDLYSFDCDESTAMITYERVLQQYHKIFNQLDIKFICVEAKCGDMGGSLSHEFHVPANTGEDIILFCNSCKKGYNKELLGERKLYSCKDSSCSGEIEECRAIEIGHCFILGDKYSKAFNLDYIMSDNIKKNIIMGCYGIGVTRLLSVCIESLSNETKIRWPLKIAPFQVSVLLQKTGAHDYPSDQLKTKLIDKLVENFRNNYLCASDILVDDSDFSIGKKLLNSDAIGIPWSIVVKNNEILETVDVYQNKVYHLSIEEAVATVTENYTQYLDKSAKIIQ